MFLPSMELVAERARRERRRLVLFIGRLGRCPGGEIFLAAILIHQVDTPLTLSSHIAMAGACSAHAGVALAATPVVRHGGDHGADS